MELKIESLGINGEGVAHHNGYTIFVEGALPRERVHVELTEQRKTYGRAKVIRYLETSSDRIDPACPLFGRCGGCQLMHLTYSKQLEAKRQRVQDALERIAKLKVEVLPCIASPTTLGYRNKIQLPVSSTNHLGLYARSSHDLVEIESCQIHCPLGERVFQEIQQLLKQFPFPHLRHVLIKTAVNTNQVLVILVTKTEEEPLLLAQKIIQAMPEIKGVIQNINASEGNVILSPQFRTLAGEGFIVEKLCGLQFKVSPASFFQVNPAQAERLYQTALEFAAITSSESVLDAYCGVGTLSLILAIRAKEVIGVECVSDAIIDAKENAALNKIKNVEFHCAAAEEFISTMHAIDVAILNPPRSGCERSFLEQLRAKRVIYISCDPATLARDLAVLSQRGYQITDVQPFDMFPQTAHVECVVKMECNLSFA